MILRPIFLVAILITFLLILIVPVVWLSYKNQKPNSVNISQGQNLNKKFCHAYPVPCQGEKDDFCSQTCLDNMEYSCQDVSFPSFGDKKMSVATTKKFCLPEKSAEEYKCKPEKNGCVPAWTGWASTDRMEWDSLCMFPDYFGGNGCAATPGVCTLNGVSFMAKRDYSLAPPSLGDCVLPADLTDDYAVIPRQDGSPMIVMKSQCRFYKGLSPGEPGLPDQCKKDPGN